MTTSTHSHKAWTDKGGHVNISARWLPGQQAKCSAVECSALLSWSWHQALRI